MFLFEKKMLTNMYKHSTTLKFLLFKIKIRISVNNLVFVE